MFNLLLVLIFALTTNNFLSSAEKQAIRRVKDHKRQYVQHAQDDFFIPRIPPTTDPIVRKKSSSVSYNTSPVEDNLSAQESLLRYSAPVPRRTPQIIPDDLSTRSFSEGSVVKQSPKKKDSYLKRKLSNSKKSPKITPLAPIMEKSEHPLLIAIRNNRIDQVKFYLKNQYLQVSEIMDAWKNTALHIAALKENFEIINMLLLDPRTDASQRNKHTFFPRDLLDKHEEVEGATLANAEIIKYKRMLFARCTLNTVVNCHAKKIFLSYMSGSISPDDIDATVNIIKEKINSTTEKQSTDLPIVLPSYATDNFITNMLSYRLALLESKSN